MGFGDNIAADLTAPGIKLSLGSSGTFYQDLDHATYDPTGACHVLRNGKDAFMGMFVTDCCGKLAQRVVKDCRLSWEDFNANVANPQWDNPGESVFMSGDQQIRYFAGGKNIAGAVTRSILMNIKRRCAFMGKPPFVVVTGGFGKPEVAKMAADIWGCPAYVTPTINRVAYGSGIWSMTQEMGRVLGIVATVLCPTGEKISPDPDRAYFYQQFGEEFDKRFPV
jgi:sugar (pentulose or hexulose) kinase